MKEDTTDMTKICSDMSYFPVPSWGKGYSLSGAIFDVQKITDCYLESVVLQGQKQEELLA